MNLEWQWELLICKLLELQLFHPPPFKIIGRMKNRYNREAAEKEEGYRMGKRETNRLLKKSIFLPNPNDLGVFELFFEVSLRNPFRDESLNWMDLQWGKSCVFSFMGSKTKHSGKISNCMLRCNNSLRWELTSVHRHNIGRRHSTENALEINLNFIRKKILNTKV